MSEFRTVPAESPTLVLTKGVTSLSPRYSCVMLMTGAFVDLAGYAVGRGSCAVFDGQNSGVGVVAVRGGIQARASGSSAVSRHQTEK